jgi:hypothetical protein
MLKRDFPEYALRPPPSSSEISNAEAIIATKVCSCPWDGSILNQCSHIPIHGQSLIASKTDSIKMQYAQRSQLQDEWCEFAAEMTAKIHEINDLQVWNNCADSTLHLSIRSTTSDSVSWYLQQQVHEEQARLDSRIGRDIFSQVKTEQRSSKLRTIESAWDSIDRLVQGADYTNNKAVLATAMQYSKDQPVLSAVKIRSDASVGQQRSEINLTDVVKDAKQFIQAVRHRVAAAKTGGLVESLDSSSLVDACTHHIAQLNTMVQRTQKLLAQIKDSNDEDARRLYLELAGSSGADFNMMSKSVMNLCPPTPALPAHEQYKLVSSMKKITMAEMSGNEKQIKREQIQQIEGSTSAALQHDNREGSVPHTVDNDVIRQLKYEDIGHGEQEME